MTNVDEDTNDVIEQFRPYVRKIARRHGRRRRAHTEDLMQAGFEGLVQALRKYSPERGRFENYAYHFIDGAVRKAAAQVGNTGWTVPEHVRTKLVQKRRALDRLARAGNLEPERAEVADEMGITDEEMDVIDGVSSHVTSMDTAELTKSDDPEDDVAGGLHEALPTEQRPAGWDAPFESPEYYGEVAEARHQVERLLDLLGEHERNVVIDIYWGGMSERQIGQAMEPKPVTKQAVNKVHRRALNKMRVEAEARGWAPDDRKPRFTATEAAIRAFMQRRVETVQQHRRRYDEYDAENDIYF